MENEEPVTVLGIQHKTLYYYLFMYRYNTSDTLYDCTM